MTVKFYKVEKGVPLPEPQPVGQPKGAMYRPWDRLAVGDSFFVRGGSIRTETACAASAGKLRNGERFVARQVPGGVRVWRAE